MSDAAKLRALFDRWASHGPPNGIEEFFYEATGDQDLIFALEVGCTGAAKTAVKKLIVKLYGQDVPTVLLSQLRKVGVELK